MTRPLRFHLSVTAILLCWSVSAVAQLGSAKTPQLGLSLAGAEFGVEGESFSNENPGKSGVDYVVNSASTLRYFSRAGLRLVRLPFRWERIQPQLRRPLNKKHLHELRAFCSHAEAAGISVILDVHNYARYRLVLDGKPRTHVIDELVDGNVPVDRQDLADLWTRLAISFRDAPAVIGYGIMNEPHDMGDSDWKLISQTAVDAIRLVDQETTVVVAGEDWSSAERFRQANGERPWIQDPQNNVVYEAHCYFDENGSGKYERTFADEQRQDPELESRGVRRIQPFITWCHQNQVRGLIGEFGVPNDVAWRETTNLFLAQCRDSGIAACYWAGGEWWGKYPLSIQPSKSKADAKKTDALQLQWLQDSMRAYPRTREIKLQR